MTKWLSSEWFDRTRALAADQPEYAGLSARVQYEVTGGPDGGAHYYWVLVDGHLTDSSSGTVGEPDVTLTMAWDDAVAVQQGNLDPSVAFMQGRMKVVGSMGVLLALLPVASTGAYRDLRHRIAELTEF